MRRSPSGSDAGSVASFRSKGSRTSRTSRSSTRPLEEIAGKLNSEASERFGSMGTALKGLKTDTLGNVSRGEVRRLFEELGQNRKTADQCFDSMSDRGSVDVSQLRDVLDYRPQRSRGSSRAGSEAGDLVTTIKPSPFSRVPAPDSSLPESAREAWTAPGLNGASPEAGMDRVQDVDRRSNTSADRANVKEQASENGEKEKPEKKVRGPVSEGEEINYEELFLSRNISPQLTRNLQLLGPALGRKFRTIRRAFRDVDTDHSNTVDRDETREFFRNFGFIEPGPADEFFDAMDSDGGGLVDYREFQKVFAPYIYGKSDLGSSCLPMKPREKIERARSEPKKAPTRSDDTWNCRGRKLNDNELSKIVGQVSDIMDAKYGSIRKAFKGVSENHETMLSRQDVRSFFRGYGFANVADQFFDRLDQTGRGRINYREFQAHFARHLEPTHNVCKRVNDRFFGEETDSFDGQTTYRSSYACGQARGLL
mmetsp:Transcript_108399/g.203440  ORF Transcript_108399/g.203440 Transcript_108399/m.203440 type:complete len:481 (-) Transcript_108399:142-1584(-)